jgi:hypothetical protein
MFTDKIYLFLSIAIGITVLCMIGSWYVKSCIKNEMHSLKKEKKKSVDNIENLNDQTKHQKEKAENVPEHRYEPTQTNMEPDMDSYMDPVGNDGVNNPQYQDLEDSYPSPSGADTVKDGILMRDIIDKQAFENRK